MPAARPLEPRIPAQSTDYRWVDLTHTLSCDTPHWFGFEP